MGDVIQGPWRKVDGPTLDIQNFAHHKNVSVGTVRRWIREGMPADRDANGHPRFNLVRVDPWLAERSVA